MMVKEIMWNAFFFLNWSANCSVQSLYLFGYWTDSEYLLSASPVLDAFLGCKSCVKKKKNENADVIEYFHMVQCSLLKGASSTKESITVSRFCPFLSAHNVLSFLRSIFFTQLPFKMVSCSSSLISARENETFICFFFKDTAFANVLLINVQAN